MDNNFENITPVNNDDFAVEPETLTTPSVDPDELAHAEQEAAKSGDSYTHTFRNPIPYNNTLIMEITFTWGELTGNDGLAIENEMAAQGKMVIVPAFSGEYLIRMAARASKPVVGSDFFKKVSLGDYNKIRSAARSFLLKSE